MTIDEVIEAACLEYEQNESHRDYGVHSVDVVAEVGEAVGVALRREFYLIPISRTGSSGVSVVVTESMHQPIERFIQEYAYRTERPVFRGSVIRVDVPW